MDIISISDAIQKKISLLELGRKELQKRAELKAASSAEYDKVLGITLIRLKNNDIKEHEGFPVVDLPASILEKVAKSICWKGKLEAEKCEVMYRNATIGMNSIFNELSALQSLYKHQSEA